MKELLYKVLHLVNGDKSTSWLSNGCYGEKCIKVYEMFSYCFKRVHVSIILLEAALDLMENDDLQ